MNSNGRPMAMLLGAVVAAGVCLAAPAGQLVVYRELVDGQPQGAGRFFAAPTAVLVRATFAQPLPNPRVNLKLLRNGISVLGGPFEVKGDTKQFDLRLAMPDGAVLQPGVYAFTISQGGQALADTAFLVGTAVPPRAQRVYLGPILPVGADAFAQPTTPAGGTPTTPSPSPLVIFRRVGAGQPPEVKTEFLPSDRLGARLTLAQPPAGGLAHLKIAREGAVMSEGDIELKDRTVFEIDLVNDIGFPPGRYTVTISAGDRKLGEAAFTVRAPGT